MSEKITIRMKQDALFPIGPNEMRKAIKHEVVSVPITYAEEQINRGLAEQVFALPDRQYQGI